MNQVVLQRKLSIPNSGELINRPDLIDKLTSYSQSPLTVIAAPAGYGKTSLVCDWLRYANHPVYWLSLDEQNNLPSSFWHYLYACLKQVDAQLDEQVVHMLETHFIDDYCVIVDLVLAALEKLGRQWHRPQRAVIVLDDFQFIDHPQIIKSFNRFLDYLPSWLQVVITARKPPALMLANRCSKLTANLIQVDELIFKAEQISDFLAIKLGLQVNELQQQTLFNKTEGWAAAIQLTGLALKSGKSFEQCTSTNESLLANFLFEEVFSQLDLPTQRLLIDISLVDHFDIELCQLFESDRDNEELLDNLVNQGLFISQIESGKHQVKKPSKYESSVHSFRMHSLFRQWILDNKSLQAEELIKKQYITLNWLIDNTDYHQALDLSIELCDWQTCSELMIKLYPSLIQVTHFDHVSSILQRIPDNVIQQLPHLCLLAALIHFSQTEYDKVAEYTDHIANFFHVSEVTVEKEQETLLMMGSMILQAQVARFSGQGDQAKEINLTAESLYYSAHTHLNCWIELGKGVDSFFDDNIQQAIEFNRTALYQAREVKDGLCVIAALSWLLHSLYHNGQITLAIDLAEENLTWLQQGQYLSYPNVSSIHAVMSVLYLESNQLSKAWESYEQLLASINEFTEPREIIYNKFHTHYQLLSSTGRFDEARTCLQQLASYENQLNIKLGPDFSILLDTQTFSALLDVKTGNNFPLLQLINQKNQLQKDVNDPYRFRQLFEEMIVACGTMIMTSGEENNLIEIANTSLLGGNNHRAINCFLIAAKVLFALGEEEKAFNYFQQVLDLNKHCQFLNLIIEDENKIRPLIERAIEINFELPECTLLLAAINNRCAKSVAKIPVIKDQGRVENIAAQRSINHGRVENLSARELEVLSLINQGNRNKQVAVALSISLSTVKRHLQNIYQKLQVNSRTEAISLMNSRS